ncbi:hypothetical protein [cf. Phormidesmis sp. LEGE 11477]|uniref:hypothetical protein n=1 Tax=cf. Phormidesmis sp. LEGE 11477 TaxID=1828680 RepID=UPI00187DE9C9|nr:hypothetical protein [cf. Phormidesmis sp. LEGE 11477]MBE9063567.1 hypothetical protein [cf. Phormidesmis sp. LEGE 11477]
MQALKLHGKIDSTGKLIISEPVNLAPGDVEIIVLQSTQSQIEESSTSNHSFSEPESSPRLAEQTGSEGYRIKALANWFANLPSETVQINSDEAKWQALRRKHDL